LQHGQHFVQYVPLLKTGQCTTPTLKPQRRQIAWRRETRHGLERRSGSGIAFVIFDGSYVSFFRCAGQQVNRKSGQPKTVRTRFRAGPAYLLSNVEVGGWR
jgi:hypothetical protein